MPRRSILSAAERESLLALPDTRDDLIRRYTLSDIRSWRSFGNAAARPTGSDLPCSSATSAFRALCSGWTSYRLLLLLHLVAATAQDSG